MRQISPAVEFYSIDEQFFDAAFLEQCLGCPPREAVERLQARVFEATGIPVTIGVARSKTLAKLASKAAKPFGCRVLAEQEETQKLLAEQPIEKITGVAERTRRKLEPYGIRTALDFAAADRRLIRKLLTKTGEELWWELHGTQVKPLQTTRPPHKVIARGGSVGRATNDPDRIYALVVRNLERLIEALDFYEVHCDHLGLELQGADSGFVADRFSLPQSTAQFALLAPAAAELFRRLWRPGETIQYMHVVATGLRSRSLVQRSLFAETTPRQREAANAKRKINDSVGRFMVRSGATLPLYDLYCDRASSYEICDIHGKSCF